MMPSMHATFGSGYITSPSLDTIAANVSQFIQAIRDHQGFLLLSSMVPQSVICVAVSITASPPSPATGITIVIRD
jgi:hypothetical protein